MSNDPKEPKKNFLSKEFYFGRVDQTQKILFAKNLSVMLKSGLAITEALNITSDAASGQLRQVIREIFQSVASGSTVASALSRYPKIFSGFFVGAIYTGEFSGTLVENLELIASELEKEQALASKIKSAMIYPAVVLGAVFILGLALSFLVLPKIIPFFEGLKMKLPFSTRALIWFSHLVKEKGIYIFGSMMAFFVFVGWCLRQKFSRPITHWLLLNAPVLKGITRNANLSKFCRTLGMLLKSGVNIDQAMRITQQTIGNYYYSQALKQISQSIPHGKKLSEHLGRYENLFPVILVKMVMVGEESGKFEETLSYLANFYEIQVDYATKSFSVIIEPLLLMFLGAIVSFFALSILSPIYNITGGLRH